MPTRTPSFADFDARARNGEQLTIVFLGGSLTWGANATDPATTSYRALIAEKLFEKYPRAPFKFFDAAIGGTGSRLGAFRLDRDVLRRKPDLVFLDFTANDDITTSDPETCASYESLLRRLILEHHIPVVQLLFPFKANAVAPNTSGLLRRDAHLALSAAYNTPVGDAIALAQSRVQSGQINPDQIWSSDPIHPGDSGYALFADAAWQAYLNAVHRQLVCRAPQQMLYANTYMTVSRLRLSALFPAPSTPAGWSIGTPSLGAAFHDALMSRWLDDVLIARKTTSPVSSLRLRFRATSLLLFGEETLSSGTYRVLIDNQPLTRKDGSSTTDLFNATSKRFGGNRHHVQTLAHGLDPSREHTLEIEPILTEGQELRLESLCLAGAPATATRAD